MKFGFDWPSSFGNMSTKTARRGKYGTETLLVGTQLNDLYAYCFFLSVSLVKRRKTSPRTSTIVQFIFYFGPLRSAIIF